MRVAALLVWVVGGLVAWSVAMTAGDQMHGVDPVSAELLPDGSAVAIDVPGAGGCEDEHQFPSAKHDGDRLLIWVEEPDSHLRCLGFCEVPEGVVCTVTLILELDEPVDPTTPIVLTRPWPHWSGEGVAASSIGLLTLAIGLRLWRSRRRRASGKADGSDGDLGISGS